MDVAHPGPCQRFIGQRVFAVADGRLERPLADVVGQRRARDRAESGQDLPALKPVVKGLPEPGISLVIQPLALVPP